MANAGVNGGVLAFTLGLSLATGLLVGVAPAIQQSSRDVRHTLDDGARGGSTKHGVRASLVVAQIAMALIVLVASALLGRSFVALERVRPGFMPANVLTLQLSLPRTKYDSTYKLVTFFDQLTQRASAIPGAVEVSGGYPVPMSGDGWSGSIRVEGEPDGPNDPIPHAEYGVALPGYFHTLAIPLVAGREFSSTDTPDAPPVAIVDAVLARQHWPNQSAIGKRVNGATVVGVVGHVHKAGPQSEGEPQIYLPFAQNPQRTLSIVARARAAPLVLSQPIRAVVRDIDAQLPVARLRTLDDLVGRSTARQRLDAALLAVFALTALLLASVGLYGVMAYVVSQRTREIGIRVALGGQPSSIRAMVLREGLVLSLTGLAIGVVASLLLSRALAGLLFGVSPTDPVTYVAIAGLLVLVSLLASYGPARRATRVDPLVALKL